MKDIKCKQVLVPVEMFEEAGLDDDMVIEMFVDNGRIVIQQADEDAVNEYENDSDCYDECEDCPYFCRSCGGCALGDDCEDA